MVFGCFFILLIYSCLIPWCKIILFRVSFAISNLLHYLYPCQPIGNLDFHFFTLGMFFLTEGRLAKW